MTPEEREVIRAAYRVVSVADTSMLGVALHELDDALAALDRRDIHGLLSRRPSPVHRVVANLLRIARL